MRHLLGYYLVAFGFCLTFLALYVSNIIGFPFFLLVMPVVSWPFTLWKRLTVRRAGELRSVDARAPVLLLRSFADDGREVVKLSSVTRFILTRYLTWDYSTFEELLVRVFSMCGPVIAIGRPGEVVPPLGAAREWLPHDAWQCRVRELLAEARLVVIVLGDMKGEDGLTWEIQNVLEMGLTEKLVIVVPPVRDRRVEPRWERLALLLGHRLPLVRGGELAVSFAGGATEVSRGSRKRREFEYLDALLPVAARFATPRHWTVWRVVYELLACFFPIRSGGALSWIMAGMWFVVVMMIIAGAALALLPVHPGIAAAWVAVSLLALGRAVAFADEMKQVYCY
jgi:hypothetical protein